MGSIEDPSEENGSADQKPATGAGDGAEKEALKRRKASMLPLEVGTRVMCRWRDGKYHPVKVIERRKVFAAGSGEYEYYVHYTECKDFFFFFLFFTESCCVSRIRDFGLKMLLKIDFVHLFVL